MNESFTLKNFYFYLIVIAFLTVAVFPYNPVLGTIGVIAWVLTASYAYRSVKKYNGIVNDQFNNLHKDFEKITERTIFSMPFPLVVTDREGTIVWHNSLFGELFDVEILKGKSLPAYIEDLADEETGLKAVENGTEVEIKEQPYRAYNSVVDFQKTVRKMCFPFSISLTTVSTGTWNASTKTKAAWCLSWKWTISTKWWMGRLHRKSRC